MLRSIPTRLYSLAAVVAGLLACPNLAAQVQLVSVFRGKLLPIVDTDGVSASIRDDKNNISARLIGYQIQAAPDFAPGFVEIRNEQADHQPIRADAAKNGKQSPETRFHYRAALIADRTLARCFGLLTYVTEGSISSHVIAIGTLDRGTARDIKLDLDEYVGSVGSLHVFADGKELRSTSHPDRYDLQAYYNALTRGAPGLSAAELLMLKEQVPHALSHDGRFVATLRDRTSGRVMIVYDLATMKLVAETKVADLSQTVRDLNWISDHEIAYVTSSLMGLKNELDLIDTATGNVRKLHDDIAGIICHPREKPDELVVEQHRTFFDQTFARYNIRTGIIGTDIDEDRGGYYLFDRNGIPRVRIEYDTDEVFYSFRPTPTADWKWIEQGSKVKGFRLNRRSWEYLDRVADIHSIGPDGDILYMSTRLNSDRFELVAFSMSQGVIKQTIASHPKYDLTTTDGGIARLLFAKKTAQLIGLIYDAEKPHVVWLDPRFAAVQKAMDHTFADHVNLPVDWSDDGRTFVFFSSSDTDPGTYYAFRPLDAKLIPLLDLSDHLKGKVLSHTMPFEYSARDGQKIPAYLTLPPGTEHQKTPLLVSIHGGPMDRDTWGFDPTNQFFGSRGYKVLQVNYRGSSGYGASFQKAGLNVRLDTVVIDDIADAVRYLVAQGEVDPSRIAVMGASFGGWATYLSLIRYPDLYRAGIAISAVSNWHKELKSDRRHDIAGYQFWKALLNRHSFAADEPFIEPTLRAAEINQPVLILHGLRDQIVEASEADLMFAALKKTNANAQIREFPQSGHSNWTLGEHVELLNESAKFLSQWINAPRS